MKVDHEIQSIRRTKKGSYNNLDSNVVLVDCQSSSIKLVGRDDLRYFCCEIWSNDGMWKRTNFRRGFDDRQTDKHSKIVFWSVRHQTRKRKKTLNRRARPTSDGSIWLIQPNRITVIFIRINRGGEDENTHTTTRVDAHTTPVRSNTENVKFNDHRQLVPRPYSFDLFPRVWVTHPVCLTWSTASKALSLVNWEDSVCSCSWKPWFLSVFGSPNWTADAEGVVVGVGPTNTQPWSRIKNPPTWFCAAFRAVFDSWLAIFHSQCWIYATRLAASHRIISVAVVSTLWSCLFIATIPSILFYSIQFIHLP